MTRHYFVKACDDVQKFHGDRMPMMVMEEAGELIQAISKYERNANEQGLIDEIGDMYISLMALTQYYESKIDDIVSRIDSRISSKLKKKYKDENTGYFNAGNRNVGNGNAGEFNTGNCNTGNCNTGDFNTGDWNTGCDNTGYRNTGDFNVGSRNVGSRNVGNANTGRYNVGNCNTGYWNTGDYNPGNYNTGYRNIGSRNTGDCNAGHFNAGDYNTGDFNTGNRNTGHFNITDGNNGCFSVKTHTITLFDKPSDWTLDNWNESEAYEIMLSYPSPLEWISIDNMTDEEKEAHLEAEITRGYLKQINIAEEAQKWWNDLSDEDKREVMSLPNFDAEIFYKCTKIRV